ncbi:MAG: sugar transferase [Myxococcales bacterium]
MRRELALAVKRGIDIVAASIGLALSLPLMTGVAVAVRIQLGTPVLFRQLRPGLGGKPFMMVKFRTMRPPRRDEVWFRTDDDRLTPLGRLLRRTSIDELPELWNVLRGDMSLVGPRPLLMEYLEKYTPEQARRHDVKPGITGWAQVNGRQNIQFSKRLQLDLFYVDQWSLPLDLKILMMTMGRVFRSEGVIPGQSVDDVDDLGLSKKG